MDSKYITKYNKISNNPGLTKSEIKDEYSLGENFVRKQKQNDNSTSNATNSERYKLLIQKLKNNFGKNK